MKLHVGMILLTISAVLPQFRPPPCSTKNPVNCQQASWWQLGILYVSLLLTALGAGGIRPCVVAFGADQFDETDPKNKTKTWNFFNWYYFLMGLSMLLAVTVVVYIQDNVGWGLGLGIPTAAMTVSVVSFVAGYRMYRRLDPAGSPFTRLVQVVVAAYRKRKLATVEDARLLYENDEIDAPISLGGKLIHTKQWRHTPSSLIKAKEEHSSFHFEYKIMRVHVMHDPNDIGQTEYSVEIKPVADPSLFKVVHLNHLIQKFSIA